MKTLELVVNTLRETKTGIFKEALQKWETIQINAANIRHTNLKIHNVSYYLYEQVRKGLISEKQEVEIFQRIAEQELDFFEDWEQENLSYVKREYIGRTSSFYFNTKWEGNHIQNWAVDELLEGKKVNSTEIFGELNEYLYDFLFTDYVEKAVLLHDNLIEYLGEYEDENELLEDLQTELDGAIELLHEIDEDLLQLLEIVEEANKAYSYLAEYKTKENEYSIASDYLQYMLEDEFAEKKGNDIFDTVLFELAPLNKIQSVDIYSETNEKTYIITIETNNIKIHHETEILISNDIMVAKYLKGIIDHLIDLFNHNFDLGGGQ